MTYKERKQEDGGEDGEDDDEQLNIRGETMIRKTRMVLEAMQGEDDRRDNGDQEGRRDIGENVSGKKVLRKKYTTCSLLKTIKE